ncbi:RanBP2-type zinc finger protein [Glycine max]|nr:RanBP2-type zinc finger protein [Glycine max]
MSRVDNRNSSATKRARTDGSRREDDWTCPSCGNVNFSFRTTCNMRNCTQPRPADHNSKSAAKPLQAPQGYSSSAPYLGSNTPSSIYLGVPPYGSSLFNGSSVPPYDVPFSGGSAYHYNYGSRLSAGSPYRPLHLSGPTPYTGGPVIGNGGIYGMPQLLDRYGLGIPIGPGTMGARPGFFHDDKSQKKDATRDNDWTCPKCGNVNFSFRTVCNMRKCNTPKPGSQASKSDKNSKQKMPEGSWKCEKCNNINYPFRTKCNRQNCGADKPAESEESPSSAADQNDQLLVFQEQNMTRMGFGDRGADVTREDATLENDECEEQRNRTWCSYDFQLIFTLLEAFEKVPSIQFLFSFRWWPYDGGGSTLQNSERASDVIPVLCLPFIFIQIKHY